VLNYIHGVILEISPFLVPESSNLRFFTKLETNHTTSADSETRTEDFSELLENDDVIEANDAGMQILWCAVIDPYSENGPSETSLEERELEATPSEYVNVKDTNLNKLQLSHIILPKRGNKICPFVGGGIPCRKEYASLSNLTIHLKSHVNIRPYSCEEELCHKSFKLKSHLKQHLYVHKNQTKRFVCPTQGCASSFKRPWHLREHVEAHVKPAKHQCPVDGCTKAYQGKSNLVIHLRYHSGERPFPCSVC